jgi:WD40 repeat protein
MCVYVEISVSYDGISTVCVYIYIYIYTHTHIVYTHTHTHVQVNRVTSAHHGMLHSGSLELANNDGRVSICSLQEIPGGITQSTLVGYRHEGAIWVSKFNYDYSMLATGGMCGKVFVWQVERQNHENSDGTSYSNLPPPKNASKKYPPENATCDSGPRIRKPAIRVFEGHDGEVLDLAWSNDSLIASAGTDWLVKLWHPSADARCLRVFDHPHIATGVAFHPLNQQLLFTSCLDGALRLFDLRPDHQDLEGKAITEVDTKVRIIYVCVHKAVCV